MSEENNGEPAAVRLRGVEKTFGDGATAVRALRGIDLDVAFGEVHMIVGPSGCGKTTLISIAAGVLDADAGEVSVLGERLDRMTAARKTEFRRRSLGFIFQQYNLLPTLTVAENVAVPLILNGVPRGQAVRRAQEALGRVGIGEKAGMLPRLLSGGQQQRVAIARALVHEPALLVCDEPTAALDGESGRRVMEILKEVALAHRRAVLVVTHDNRIFKYGQRFAFMVDGRVERVTRHPEEAHA
jgi:putative ABC transport system ATP-binding protein